MRKIKHFVRNHFSNGLAEALGAVLFEARLLVVHRKSIRDARRLLDGSLLKLNCGSGPVMKRGWINIDVVKGADLRLDLREKLPFPSGSVSFIHSEHLFEHLAYPNETGVFLAESLRILIQGGRFRVGVPDTIWPLRAYVNGEDEYFEMARELWHPADCDTKMHHINYHFRQGSEHKYAYDYETLAKVLIKAGFVKVERSDFDPALDSEHRRVGTLYVDAFKGA